ncbi:hypothetical protein LUZ60_003148 [Juncus effusus]|nr:hypothetical protein LUZ60_003148 [Juncus effusus]
MANPSTPSDPPLDHGALYFVLHYLPLPELLSFQAVSKTFCDAVSNDPSLWQHIAVKRPLNYSITDEALLRLTSRAEGRLKSLFLLDCYNITDAGLFRIVDQNPGITKLFVPGCINLTPNGMINLVKHSLDQNRSLTHLKLYGLCNIKEEHLKILNSLLSKNNKSTKPSIYGSDHPTRLTINGGDGSDRPVDLELCPFCQSIGLVYNCTRNNCRRRDCRACYFCVPRCEDCGGCMDTDHVSQNDSACNHLLCTQCWLKLPKCDTCNRPYCKGHNIFKQSRVGFICQGCCDGAFLEYLPEAGY